MRYLVTAAHDQTIRVWEMQTGRLLRTIRPPFDEGLERMHRTVAISPDGRVIATTQESSLYIFDRERGELVRRIRGLEATRLVYSPDGRFLAVLLEKRLRIVNTNDYSVADEDQEYDGQVRDADFGPKNLIVSAATDFLQGITLLHTYDIQQHDLRAGKTGRDVTPVESHPFPLDQVGVSFNF
jgi:WD40 repeat protein